MYMYLIISAGFADSMDEIGGGGGVSCAKRMYNFTSASTRPPVISKRQAGARYDLSQLRWGGSEKSYV